jgi:K+-sensing histidine kinase KdpD
MSNSNKNYFEMEDKYSECTLVCVTDQFRCEKLIKAGRLLADKTRTNLYIFNVSSPIGKKADFSALEHLFNVSKENKAVMNIFYGKDVLEVLKKLVGEYNAVNVVTGCPESEDSILASFWEAFPDLDFYMLEASGKLKKVQHAVVRA